MLIVFKTHFTHDIEIYNIPNLTTQTLNKPHPLDINHDKIREDRIFSIL